VLLEVALQPCGWLASFAGSALVLTRSGVSHLDGTGQMLAEVPPGAVFCAPLHAGERLAFGRHIWIVPRALPLG